MKGKLAVILAAILIGVIVFTGQKDIGTQREEFIITKNKITKQLLHEAKYKCCLKKPCTYCIEKSPGHGEGATCNCLSDVMNGKHPCGECIGEILEGHGNPYISEYFAKAIAEEVGEQHTDTLKQIIKEKYGTPVDKQV